MKKVLLIGGGGTLGSYTAEELLRLGHSVDIVCLEDAVSDNENLTYHTGAATLDFLQELFAKKRYDGIVNFVHYSNHEDYKPIHALLTNNTDHLIFVSSYRVYADEQHPITENAPRLVDVIRDPYFLENEKYAVPKAKCEDYLRNACAGEPWTIVRPVISFSQRRMDLLMYSGQKVLKAASSGTELLLPELAKDYTAGLDWAGNSGKLIANLQLKPSALGETYSIYSGHGLTWNEVAALYEKHLGLKVRWVSEEEYLDFHTVVKTMDIMTWAWKFDRRFNRDIDCTKVLAATGLGKEDFATVEEGILTELRNLDAIE